MTTVADRYHARLALLTAHAGQVHDYLVSLGARDHEVTVSYQAIGDAVGINVPDVGSATLHLVRSRQVVRDRRTDRLVAYTYRVVK